MEWPRAGPLSHSRLALTCAATRVMIGTSRGLLATTSSRPLGRIAPQGRGDNVCQERGIWRSLPVTAIVDKTLKKERGGVFVKVDGAKLAAARERVFMSQDELAESIGMNPAVVIRLETEDRTEIRENLGEDLMQILFVGRSELTSYPEPPEPPLEDPGATED